MKTLAIAGAAAVAALYLLPASAGAFFPAPSDMAGVQGVHTVIDSSGRSIDVVSNANACAPFDSLAVWGPGPNTAPIGYHCFNPRNR